MYHKNTPGLRRLNRGGQQSSQIKSKAATERTGPAASAAGPALICRSYIFVPPVGPPAGAALAGGGFGQADDYHQGNDAVHNFLLSHSIASFVWITYCRKLS